MAGELTHLDEASHPRMVDVGEKAVTARSATAEAWVELSAHAYALASEGRAKKGDVFLVAELAGIAGAKRTADLIPLCHPIPLTGVDVAVEAVDGRIRVRATARCEGRTGVEMEALCAASAAALTVYDMLKAVDRGMRITGVRLLEKSGGRSGTWRAEEA